jgi:hypothetical protein
MKTLCITTLSINTLNIKRVCIKTVSIKTLRGIKTLNIYTFCGIITSIMGNIVLFDLVMLNVMAPLH